MTIALLAYRQERFIAEAVKSVFDQAIQPLEIILSDDHSPDATFETIKQAAANYEGFAEVRIRRNVVNLGIAEHFNQVMSESRGDVVVVCAGDDISLATRTGLTASYFQSNDRLTALSLRQRRIDEFGRVTAEPGPVSPASLAPVTLEKYLKGRVKHPSAASRAYRKDVFQLFGPLAPQCPSEDTPMLIRSMLLGEVRDFGEVGILYCRHAENLSNLDNVKRMKTEEIRGQQRADLQKAFQLRLLDQHSLRRYEWLLEGYWARRRLKVDVAEQGTWSALASVLSEPGLSVAERLGFSGRLIRRRVWSRVGR